MITPDGIREKAIRQFPRYLDWVLDGIVGAEGAGDFFPLAIPSDRGSTGDDFFERKRGLELLWERSKARTGRGYTLETAVVRTRSRGEQTVIAGVRLESEVDFLQCARMEREASAFRSGARAILGSFPRAEAWARRNASALATPREGGFWDSVALCARWLLENPASGLFVREIPLPVHTKFIEENKAIIASLARFLRRPVSGDPHARDGECPDSSRIDAPSIVRDDASLGFEAEFGLASAESAVRFRSLDGGLALRVSLAREGSPEGSTRETRCRELSLPVSDFALFGDGLAREAGIRSVFVVENLLVYETFPRVRGALCVFGGGFGAARLRPCAWLNSVSLFYFGDLDEHGFEILSDFRSLFPGARSFCMDTATLEAFGEHRVPGKRSRRRGDLPCLDASERETLAALARDPDLNRLEQERVSQSFVLARLRAQGLLVGVADDDRGLS